MRISQRSLAKILALTLTVTFIACSIPEWVAAAQDAGTILAGAELSQVIPPGFYFQGRSAPTQMRNAVAARFGSSRFVIAGLVDTAGYAADVRDKYQGFLVTDSAIAIGGSELATGAYGFGFVNDGKLLIMDLSGKEILSVPTTKDDKLARPRPLMMKKSADGVQLYSGRSYVNIVAK
jgi:hypothetical protein